VRRVIASVATTLDGYLEGPGGEGDLAWLMPHVEDSLADNAAMLADETDTIVLGRRTYEGFSQYWPGQEGEFAELMNTPPKLVFSRSLTEVGWGSHANAELADEDRLRDLKAEDGKAAVILASGGLVSNLLALGLVDELRIVVIPVLLGAGLKYLRGIERQVELELACVKSYPKGSVRLTYHAV
jgi:dihydrofolate reductase